MRKQLSSWWQKRKQYRVTILVVAIILVVVVPLIIVGYRFDWTGFNGNNKTGKTLWDWLQLFIIPFALAIIAILFNRAERKNEQATSYDNQRETALQEYFDRISELLLEDKLPSSPKAVTVLGARTSTVLRLLDPIRRAHLIRFLSEADLINQSTNSDLDEIDLQEANLAKIKLSKVSMSFANLRGTNLSEADLNEACLFDTNLNGALMNEAVLTKADLRGASLNKAELLEANLSGANLHGVDLSKSGMLRANLSKANLSNAILSKSFLLYVCTFLTKGRGEW